MSPFDGVNDAENDQILAVSMQCWYLFLLVQNLPSCVQTLIFVCKLAFCRGNWPLTSCVLSPKRNKTGCGITPKRHKIGCLRLLTSAAYVQIIHKKWAKLVQTMPLLWASFSLVWPQILAFVWTKITYFLHNSQIFQSPAPHIFNFLGLRPPPRSHFSRGFVRFFTHFS